MAELETSSSHDCNTTQSDLRFSSTESDGKELGASVTEVLLGENAPVDEREQAPADDSSAPAGAASSVPPHVSLTPPEDCVKVTSDGGVLKKILEPGEPGTQPTLHARCLVHYVGYLATTGEVFMDTRRDRGETEEPAVVVAGRTAAARETGICLAAASMTRGERALVYVVDPGYGYGSLGSFSFPCVPPNCQLVYDLELVNWEGVEEIDSDRDRGSLLFEERLERAERRRQAGNSLYKEGRYKEALAKYALALSYLDEDFMYQLEGPYLDKAEAVKLTVHLNMAAVQLHTGDHNTAVYNCGQVLALQPDNVKALFRRGRARHALGRTEEALADLEAAAKIDPSDKAIVSELHAIRATLKRERQAEAALFKGQFRSATAGANGAAAATAVASAAEASAAAAAAGTGSTQHSAAAGSSSNSAKAAAFSEIEPVVGPAGGSGAPGPGKRQSAAAGKAGTGGSGKQGGDVARGARGAKKAMRSESRLRRWLVRAGEGVLWLLQLLLALFVSFIRWAVFRHFDRPRGAASGKHKTKKMSVEKWRANVRGLKS